MGINSIVNKHLSTYGEAYGFKKVKKERKYSRVIQGECLAPVAYSVLQARAENMRLRTKLRASYYVASGEADTKKKLDWKMAKDALGDAKKNIENFIKLIIEAIKNAWKWITSNKSKWEQRLPKLEKHLGKIRRAKIDKPIKVPVIKDQEATLKEVQQTLYGLKSGLKGSAKFQMTDDFNPKADNYKTKLSKEDKKATKEIASAADAEAYFKELKDLASKLGKTEDDLIKVKEVFESTLKDKERKKENKDLESKAQAMLKTTNKAIADLQKTWGRLWQGAGALLKLSPNSKEQQMMRNVAASAVKADRKFGASNDDVKENLTKIKKNFRIK